MNKYTIYGIYQFDSIFPWHVLGRRGTLYFAKIDAVIIADSEESCMECFKQYFAKMAVMYFTLDVLRYDIQIFTYKFTSIEPVDDDECRIISLKAIYEHLGNTINESLITGDTKQLDMYRYVYNKEREYRILDNDSIDREYDELKDSKFKCAEFSYKNVVISINNNHNININKKINTIITNY